MSHSGKLYTGLTAWSCTASDGTSSITGDEATHQILELGIPPSEQIISGNYR